MAKTSDLMGLGMPVFLAERLAEEPVAVTAYGTTMGSYYSLGKRRVVAVVEATTSDTAGVKLPRIGADTGCLIGDSYTVFNLSTVGITVFASGSATFIASGVSSSGNTGITVSVYTGSTFYPLSATQWAAVKGA